MKPDKKIRIVMADDHPIFRSGLRQIIEEDENIEIIGEADNGIDALKLVDELEPDIALLDINMPGKTGLEVMRELKNYKSKVIFLTVHTDEEIYDEAMSLGVIGYVLKDGAINEIVECIYKVNEGNFYISPTVSNYLFSKKKKVNKFEHKGPALDILTKTELIILKLISEGRTSREIAEMLDSSFKTIENHRTNISAKLNLKGSNSLITFAIENKSYL